MRLVAFLAVALMVVIGHTVAAAGRHCNFVRTSGARFLLGGRPIYVNGFNAYWMMNVATNPSDRGKVTSVLQQASTLGMTVARTWAFSDGGNGALQIKPGDYDENSFKALDFVISEAKKYGVHLILTLVNNWDDYGGKKQYVQWAKDEGESIGSDDDFFTNAVVKGFFKNHIQAVLSRNNSYTGIAYKDDPTIFAWELMNEPRCQSDLSGRSFQPWVEEMAAHVKSIDSNHLLDIGLEGYYGDSTPYRKQFNPGYEVGTDFIANNQVPAIDFATIHSYPEQWMQGSSDEAQSAFVQRWLLSHIQDSGSILKKPLLLTEFGKSSRSAGFTVGQRDSYFSGIYNTIYAAARAGGSCAGSLFWQIMAEGMENWGDGYEVVLSQYPTTVNVISQQSRKLAGLN